MIRVAVADDHDVLRDGLVAVIEGQGDMEAVGAAADGQGLIRLYAETKPDVAVIDLELPDLRGDEVVARLIELHGEVNAGILSTYDREVDVQRCLRAGAKSYLLKEMPREVILEGIRQIAAGRTFLPPEIAEVVTRAMRREPLTERETEILGLLATGASNKKIAAQLHVSEATVKSHVNRLLDKLGVSSRTEAATMALRLGLASLG